MTLHSEASLLIDQYQVLLNTYERMLETSTRLDWDTFYQLEAQTNAELPSSAMLISWGLVGT